MRLILGGHSAVALADPATGEVYGRTELVNPSYGALSPDGTLLYVVSEDISGPGSVHTLRVADESLTPIGEPVPSGGDQPCHLSVHPDGRHLLVANYGDGVLSVLPIGADGLPGEPTGVVRHRGDGPDRPRQAGPHVHQAITDPSGQWVLACDLGTDEVIAYALDTDHGTVTRHSAAQLTPGAGIRHLAFSPDGSRAYVAAELSSQLIVCDWDGDAGVLTPTGVVSTVSTEGGSVDRNYPAAVVMSVDGDRVYVTNRGQDSIAVVDTALFELIGTRPCEGEWPRDARLSPDGSILYVANEHTGAVVPFDVRDRVPVPTGPVIDFPEVTCVITRH